MSTDWKIKNYPGRLFTRKIINVAAGLVPIVESV